MTPERAARVVAHWVRLYTQDLPAPVAERRIEEIDADLHDHIAAERARGTADSRIALSILSRMFRGLAADGSWRAHHSKQTERPRTPKRAMTKNKTAYRSGLGLALATALMLLWAMGAVGIIGTEGDSADLMYLGVLGVGIVGAIAARFRPHGMSRALLATALACGVVAVIALIAGKHQSPISSVWEILGLNAMFATLFLGSAWLFRRAARSARP